MANLIIFIPLIAFLVYMTRQNKKRVLEHQQLMAGITDGAEIVTTGGLYGFVTAVEGDVVWLEVAEGTEIRVSKASIGRVVTSTPSSGAQDD